MSIVLQLCILLSVIRGSVGFRIHPCNPAGDVISAWRRPGAQPSTNRHDGVSNKLCMSSLEDKRDVVQLLVDPSKLINSRKVGFPKQDITDLETFRDQVKNTAAYNDTTIVVFPSWRQHVVQFDGLSAALGLLGIPTIVGHLHDDLWAYVLKRMQINPLLSARMKNMLQLQVIYAMQPMFDRLDALLREAYARHGRSLVIVAADDAAWVLRAFLNSRDGGWYMDCPVRSAVLLGAYDKSIPGKTTLEAYPAPPRTQAPPTAGRYSSDDTIPCVHYYSLLGSARKVVGGAAGGGGAQGFGPGPTGPGVYDGEEDEEVDAEDEAWKPPAEDSITCINLGEDNDDCIVSYGDQGNIAWLGSARILKLWVPKVLQ